MFKKFYIIILALFLLVSCTPKPTPFKAGDPVQPPMGCTNGRVYGVDC